MHQQHVAASQPRQAHTFIYVRTKTALQYSGDALTPLVGAIDASVEVLDVDDRCRRWDDGLVMRLRTALTPKDLAARCREPLQQLDGWSIFNLNGDVPAEMGGMGLAETFLAKPIQRGVLQVLVLYRPEDRYQQSTSDVIRRRFPQSKLGFPFRNGRMLFFDSNEDAHVSERRLENIWGLQWAIVCPGNARPVRLLRRSDDDPWSRMNFSAATAAQCVEMIKAVRRPTRAAG